jgi:hypothetical protein
VEPVPATLLTALAAGGDPADRSAWSTLGLLVRQPVRRIASEHMPPMSSGESEFAALAGNPQDTEAAGRLSFVLALRAIVDQAFHDGLRQWESATKAARDAGSIYSNLNGTVYGSAIMGRDVSVTINNPTPPGKPEAPQQPSNPQQDRRLVRQAAFRRLLNGLPRPDFPHVDWVRATAEYAGRRITLDGEFVPAVPAYRADQVEVFVTSVRKIRDPDDLNFVPVELHGSGGTEPITPDSLLRILVGLNLKRVEPQPKFGLRLELYPMAPVDAYLHELRKQLNSYFAERDGS